MANLIDGADKFQGAMVASITPFNRNGSVDYKALEELVEFFIRKGINVIVPCGTTGESSGMSHDVHGRVIEKVVEYANGRVPVLAGTGSNITKEAMKRTRHARDAGADGALLVEPYYNRPQESNVVGLYYQQIALEVPGFPLVAYHVPSRTGGRISIYTPLQLAGIPEFVGIKFANSNLDLARDIIEKVGDDLMLFSGEDGLNLKFYEMGAKGAISVTANVVPDLVADVYNMYSLGNHQEAESLQLRLHELNTTMFVSGNPDSVKTALYMMGLIKPYAIAPVGFAEGAEKQTIKEALERMKIPIINE
ncbi:MAG: 4-hydroxy-tetrahydrodipicolinate synthase [Candidatus Woesearchaeota archaeon]|nr:4-hydroxy-tetrahydrodipicolinate synthase [Candidatus Woesearchaeota archaeon]